MKYGTWHRAAASGNGAFACLWLSIPSIGHCQELESTAIYERLEPSLCTVRSLAASGEELQSGSGFAWTEALVVTNYHVVANAHQVLLDCNGGKSTATRVVGFQERVDLVILEAGASNLVPVSREVSAARPGAVVYALGNPYGLSNTITTGLVSGTRNVEGSEFLQISADIHPGNSGGPVVDTSGHVIAVATAQIEDARGLNFAIPLRYVEALPAVSFELGRLPPMGAADAARIPGAASLDFRGIPLGSECAHVRSLPDRQLAPGERRADLPPGALITVLLGAEVGVTYACLDGHLVSGRYTSIPLVIVAGVYEGLELKYGEPASGTIEGPVAVGLPILWDLGGGKQIELMPKAANAWELTYSDVELIRNLERRVATRAIRSADL